VSTWNEVDTAIRTRLEQTRSARTVLDDAQLSAGRPLLEQAKAQAGTTGRA